MSKKILLIESDAAFAREMAAAIETRGLQARVTGDGREGLDLAKADRPDAIVLCVELPKMSGYSVCNKLKKDDELKSIPLVIISAEATPATFEQHRKLKTHAEDYLLKPFDAAALLQKIAGLVELPPEPAATEALDEELVTLDDVEELEALAEVPPDAEDLPTEGVGLSLGQDEDLKLFDEAFEALEAPEASPAEASSDTVELFAASLAENDAMPSPDAAAADADAALAALGLEDAPEPELEAPALPDPAAAPGAHLLAVEPPAASAAPARGAPAVLAPPAPAEPLAASAELQSLQDRVSELRIELARRDEELQRGTADLAEAQERAHAISFDSEARERAADERARAAQEAASAARAEADEHIRSAGERAAAAEVAARAADERSAAAEERARAAEALGAAAERRAQIAEERTRAAEARATAAEAEAAAGRERADASDAAALARAADVAVASERAEGLARELDLERARAAALEGDLGALRPQLEATRGDLVAARGDAESERAAGERRVAELSKRVAELEAQTTRHEERVVKAYQKIKGDEKIREKARKALGIALQLLEDRPAAGAPAPPPVAAEVQPRRE